MCFVVVECQLCIVEFELCWFRDGVEIRLFVAFECGFWIGELGNWGFLSVFGVDFSLKICKLGLWSLSKFY